MANFPLYQVKISSRARHIRLTITKEDGLVVTIPKGFDPKHLPAILDEKQDWVLKTIDRLEQQAPVRKTPTLPAELYLRAINEKWTVVYRSAPVTRVEVKPTNRKVLMVEGAISSKLKVKQNIKIWLKEKAELILPSWLERMSLKIGIPYQGVTIRDQKTRWGSCSAQKNISLNQKLIFLPPELVDYILIHELCHTVHFSHSRKFWNLVQQYIPDYAEKRKNLRLIEREIIW